MPNLTIPASPDIEHIVILRALQLGDMLNAVPAFRALRAAYPKARISLVGLPWSKMFVEQFHTYLDHHIELPGFPGFPEQPALITELPLFLSRMQSMNIDLAIQMHGSGEISNLLVSLWGAEETAGFYLPGHYCPKRKYFLEYPDDVPEARRHLLLMEFLGIPLQGDELEIPIYKMNWRNLELIRQEHNLRSAYVCIHPGARAAYRRWPAENFAGVSDRLVEMGYQIVLTGTSDETELTGAVARHMRKPAIDLAGKTDLGTLAALVSQARLVLCNDTGLSHVAAALKTPSVVLFAVSDSVRWAPQNRQLHRTVWQAMKMKTDEVLAQVESHLEKIYGHTGKPQVEKNPYKFGFVNSGGRS